MLNQAADPFGIIGQVLDSQFRVERLVGEGGFSAVYRGHHLGLDEPIAIKCLKLPPSLGQRLIEEFERRFRDESRILYRLSQGNLNIVRSIAGGTWQSPIGFVVPFMALEWLEGRSLGNDFTIRRTVGKQGRSLDEVIQVFGSAADGLGYAHAQGVIHRDLNPGNFFFTTSPQGQRLKVLDFGVAKILDDSTLNIERNQTVGQIRIFAPAYGSPEQFDDSLGKPTATSDVYSFALILLEALRDRPVNDGTHLGEFAQRAIDPRGRPTPRALGVEVPDEVEAVFARATKLQPAERWQSAGEFWHALTHAVSAASQQRHAQAAFETPSLGMPQPVSRSTQTGMAPPPQGKAPMKRMDKTVPVGAVMPPIPTGNPRPAAGAPPGPPIPPPPQHLFEQSEAIQEEVTRIGLVSPQVPDLGEEQDDGEVTRVGAPTADALRALADVGTGTLNSVSNHNQPPPRPAAGQPGHDPNQPQQGFQPPQEGGRPPNRHAGTLMMTPGQQGPNMGPGFGPLPPPPPHAQQPQRPPMQPPMQPQPQMQGPPAGYAPQPQQMMQPQMPTTPGIGVAPNQPPPGYQQPQIQMPPQQQGMPPPQQQQMYGQQQPGAAVDPSLAPEIPKKSNAGLFIGIGVGLVVVLGVGIAAIVVASGAPSKPTVSSASASVTAPPIPTPVVTQTATAEPTAPPTVDTAAPAPVEEVDAGAVAANPTPTGETNNGTVSAPVPAPQPQGNGMPYVPPQPTAVKSAAPPVDPNAFSEPGARASLASANGVMVFCKKEGGVTGPGTASVTFNPDGSVASVAMDAPYAGTPTGDCVKGQLQRVKTKPWQGSPQTVKDSFDVPK